ncbi:YeeE/YedE family protein [Maribellus comscasis]|uniref:YeeE/YedE family protein n=1 Tax=Maribellus comscasis TaxID=2681766 RepID=A0A6I6JKI9_9BACT|nr:YeeE/YedE thiosulfate transporter family protein [Maribellus comscasis]QGY43316.1 YeeE/YedE family protein [Maribellus comscasis]
MILTVFLGFIFGGILQYAKLNKFNTISGVATLSDLTVAKAIAMAVGLGAILLNVSIGMGWAGYHVKPFVVGGIILGGLIFGVGMAILGYCPGTLAISLGEGSADALAGVIGGLFGGLIYTVLLPSIQGILGPDLGKISVNSIAGGNSAAFYAATVVLGLIFIGIAFGVHKIEKRPEKNMKWLLAGILLALLNTIVFSKGVSNRPIGASTTFPYVADWLSGFTNNSYFEKIQVPGNWEVFFLLGALLSGLILSLIRGEFKIQLIHENWVKYKNNSAVSRAIWAFIGGFVLIFGARMAGGCTSGHVISGGMQLAISSLVFAVFVFAGLLITGRVFYGKAK